MHGATLKEIKDELPKSGEDIVDVLGRILFKALVHQFPKELFEEGIKLGRPNDLCPSNHDGYCASAYRHSEGRGRRARLGQFHGSQGINGDRWTTSEWTAQHHCNDPRPVQQLGLLAREKGDHRELCKRVHERVKMGDGKVKALVLATDMAQIREALQAR